MVFFYGRVLSLLVSDLSTFLVVRQGVRHILEHDSLGPAVSGLLGGVLPAQYLQGWQFGVAVVLGMMLWGTYGKADARRDPATMLAGVMLGAVLCLWQELWTAGAGAVAAGFVASVGLVWLPLMGGRFAIDLFVATVWPPDHGVERVLLVGNPGDPVAQRVSKKLLSGGGMVSLGWVDGVSTAGTAHADPRDYWDTLHQAAADTVVAFGNLPDDIFHSVVEASTAAGCRILVVPRYEGMAKLSHGVVWHRGLPFIELTVPSLRAQHLMVKRLIDVIGAGLGLVVLAPVLALLAVAIRWDSPGPILFSQERVGLGGRTFRLRKFRTMRDGADAEKASVAHLNHTGDPRLFKIPNDPRVTRVGALLRRWSLDELPQLWNVLVGDMSLVGPRPFFESDLSAYRDHHFSRLGAKPGITGLWQVTGRSEVVDFEEVVRLDRQYIDQWSLWMDLRILARTLPAVFRRTGAY